MLELPPTSHTGGFNRSASTSSVHSLENGETPLSSPRPGARGGEPQVQSRSPSNSPPMSRMPSSGSLGLAGAHAAGAGAATADVGVPLGNKRVNDDTAEADDEIGKLEAAVLATAKAEQVVRTAAKKAKKAKDKQEEDGVSKRPASQDAAVASTSVRYRVRTKGGKGVPTKKPAAMEGTTVVLKKPASGIASAIPAASEPVSLKAIKQRIKAAVAADDGAAIGDHVGVGRDDVDYMTMPPEKLVAHIDIADLIQLTEPWETKPRRYFLSRANQTAKRRASTAGIACPKKQSEFAS